MGGPPKGRDYSVDERALIRLGRALRQVEDGKSLRQRLMRDLRAALKPAAEAAKSAVRSMPSRDVRQVRPDLRAAVARRVGTQVQMTGLRAGARAKARKLKVRGFANAPRLLNRASGWRHPGPRGDGRWYQQIGRPGWWDSPMKTVVQPARQAVRKILRDTAREIARKAR